jgi:putative tricarboxylic transport membrane protein
MVDVWVMLIAGLLGFGLKRYGFSPAPIIMGVVLGGLVETSLAQSMIIFDQQWTGFLSRPISMLFFALGLISIFNAPVRAAYKRMRARP